MFTRVDPRISANKLGEYQDVTASRRLRIMLDQARPKSVIVPFYQPAQEAITECFVSGGSDEVIQKWLSRLREQSKSSKWFVERDKSCIAALNAFVEMQGDLQLDGVKPFKAEWRHAPKLLISDVLVSVRPELLLFGTNRRGQAVCGAVKLQLCKSSPLSKTSGEAVATLLQQYAERHIAEGMRVDRNLCLVVDVAAQTIYTPPRSHVRIYHEIEVGMQEYARAWRDIVPNLGR